MALCEAMASGVPAVAMEYRPGVREIVRDGVDGVVVPAGDVPALAAAMGRLMDDPAERRRLGARARRDRRALRRRPGPGPVGGAAARGRALGCRRRPRRGAGPGPDAVTAAGPIRVALLIDTLRPAGAEKQLVTVATGLDRRRFEPRVVCLTDDRALRGRPARGRGAGDAHRQAAQGGRARPPAAARAPAPGAPARPAHLDVHVQPVRPARRPGPADRDAGERGGGRRDQVRCPAGRRPMARAVDRRRLRQLDRRRPLLPRAVRDPAREAGGHPQRCARARDGPRAAGGPGRPRGRLRRVLRRPAVPGEGLRPGHRGSRDAGAAGAATSC